MDKFIETKKKCSRYYRPRLFQWKRDVKTLFIDTFNNIFGQLRELQAQEKVTTFGLKALPRALDRHGPAYTLELEWCRGQLYKGLKIKIDLSLAIKINSHSSTMKVDFESGAGKVVKSLLHTLPYYFAVSGYTEYDVPPSNLFKEFEDKQSHFDDFDSLLHAKSLLEQLMFRDHCSPNDEPIVPLCGNGVLSDMTGSGDTDHNVPSSNLFNESKQSKESQKHTNGDRSLSLESQSDCLLRISQSCLEQSLFRDHFGPNVGPSICLRVLKVLRDMTRLLHKSCSDRHVYFKCKNAIGENAWEMITAESVYSGWQTFQRYHDPMEDNSAPDSTRWISSYSLKTLLLIEWSETLKPQRTSNGLSQRLVNIVNCLLFILKRNKGLPSFSCENYDVLPSPDEKEAESLPEAINRVTVILRFVSSFENDTKYFAFEQCIQNLKDMVMLTKQKQEVTEFLRNSLENIFQHNIKKGSTSINRRKKEDSRGFQGN